MVEMAKRHFASDDDKSGTGAGVPSPQLSVEDLINRVTEPALRRHLIPVPEDDVAQDNVAKDAEPVPAAEPESRIAAALDGPAPEPVEPVPVTPEPVVPAEAAAALFEAIAPVEVPIPAEAVMPAPVEVPAEATVPAAPQIPVEDGPAAQLAADQPEADTDEAPKAGSPEVPLAATVVNPYGQTRHLLGVPASVAAASATLIASPPAPVAPPPPRVPPADDPDPQLSPGEAYLQPTETLSTKAAALLDFRHRLNIQLRPLPILGVVLAFILLLAIIIGGGGEKKDDSIPSPVVPPVSSGHPTSSPAPSSRPSTTTTTAVAPPPAQNPNVPRPNPPAPPPPPQDPTTTTKKDWTPFCPWWKDPSKCLNPNG
ncbi:hypothetical protein D5S17_11785 [Pseudonocardiaceae bacterium YIM PH 21723]|nr:hypothetical protein D5S17_11785 [Pseudonocardiaceae bacterium YIM PH 21723]